MKPVMKSCESINDTIKIKNAKKLATTKFTQYKNDDPGYSSCVIRWHSDENNKNIGSKQKMKINYNIQKAKTQHLCLISIK